jgi:type I restriction-modification system DNA methylase subunit
MDSSQARSLIRETFTQPFDKGRFQHFIQNLLNHIDESKAAPMAVPDAFSAHVRSCRRLGTYESPDGELADVLIVNTTAPWKLERTRTALRDFVAHKLKRGDSYKEAGLIAFVSTDARSWRFSFVRMEYQSKRDEKTGKIAIEETITPARRFSYIVGEGESCHTAQTRFIDLLKDTDTDPLLADIENAFSVEAVTKEFFKLYAELFTTAEANLEKLLARDMTMGAQFKEKNISTAEFAKKLMGQIVFLYFLQKKGWLGVQKGKDWGTGPRDFLRRLAGSKYGKYDNFFNDVLEPLFYDSLATDRGHEAWCERFACRIPFLNGGLFEPLGDYDWEKTRILLPDKLFTNTNFVEQGVTGTGILDVFDRYNFTVNEAEPMEKEVAIDPEMLGKVFENLIEENRRKGLGSYYTPREIVHYMCQESLVNYLDNAVNTVKSTATTKAKKEILGDSHAKQTDLKTDIRVEIVPRGDIETLVQLGGQISHYEAVATKYAIKMPKSIEQNARLIDNKLADITICDPAVGSGAFPVGMMSEIVNARSALTPYFNDVHERSAYHFKRHAIQNSLYGVDIDPGAVEIAKLRLWLSLVVDEEDVRQIKPLPNLHYKIITGNSLLGVEKTLFNESLFARLEILKNFYFDESDTSKKLALRHEIDDIIHELTNGKETFDFEIYFSEVFHRKGGFDIVIQNPPYIQIKGIPIPERRVYEERYEFATGRFNIFYLFIERCKLVPKKHGVSSFIVPDRLLLNTQCKAIRAWLLNENHICELVSFEGQVFETVVVDSILLSFQRERRKSDFIRARRKVSQRDVRKTEPIQIPVSYFQLSPSAQFDLNFTTSKFELYRKIKANSVELVRISETKDGIIQGKVEDRLFLRTRQNADSKPLLFGEDVTKYSITFDNNWVNYKPKEMMALEVERRGKGVRPGLWMRQPQIFERSKILTRQTADEIIAAYDDQNFYYANTLHGTAITDKTYHPYYLLGVLNSRITTWYYRSNTDEEGKVFAQIKIELLRKLPIPKTDRSQQQPVIELVEKILLAKQRDADADVSALEREIDQLVYALYGLTPEEIQIVEGAI